MQAVYRGLCSGSSATAAHDLGDEVFLLGLLMMCVVNTIEARQPRQSICCQETVRAPVLRLLLQETDCACTQMGCALACACESGELQMRLMASVDDRASPRAKGLIYKELGPRPVRASSISASPQSACSPFTPCMRAGAALDRAVGVSLGPAEWANACCCPLCLPDHGCKEADHGCCRRRVDQGAYGHAAITGGSVLHRR